MQTYVDPAVARQKFDREVADYRKLEDVYLRRGWFLLKAEFPEVFVAFAAPQLEPAPLVLGVLMDFTDYDYQPPSVKIVHPITRAPYKGRELPTRLLRAVVVNNPEIVFPPGVVAMKPQPLMMAHSEDDIPFLCLPGVREYHEHPAHTGDLWALHRKSGEGTLHFLLSQISKYGVEPIDQYTIAINLKITGFNQSTASQ
jgi:hypothetical protein